jgi:hypothetical protein
MQVVASFPDLPGGRYFFSRDYFLISNILEMPPSREVWKATDAFGVVMCAILLSFQPHTLIYKSVYQINRLALPFHLILILGIQVL